MKKQPEWPPQSWADEINALNVDNAPLGPTNGAFKGPAATFNLAPMAADFITSLLDPAQPGTAAKQILVNMRAACKGEKMTLDAAAKNMGLGPSKFPSATYNSMLEYVNAKRVWQDGWARIWPWPFEASALKPDFAIADSAPQVGSLDAQQFYDQADEVGDNARTGGKNNLADVYKGFADNVKDKLSSYPNKKVLVIVDLTDNLPVETLDRDEAQTDLAAALAQVATDRARLITAIAILPGYILYFN